MRAKHREAADHSLREPTRLRELLSEKVNWQATASIRPFPNNPRIHSRAQIRKIQHSIRQGWTNPILVDEANVTLAGHGRLAAAKELGLKEVPTLTLRGLSEAEKRAILIKDNKLAEESAWDFDSLKEHLVFLDNLGFAVENTGFDTGEVDLIIDGASPQRLDPDDNMSAVPEGPPVTQPGDMWVLREHRLLCGDALVPANFGQLLQGEKAQMVVTDPPFNVKIKGHVRGRSRKRHREFSMASGEMSSSEFQGFLEAWVSEVIAASEDGSIHYIFMDWRHLRELLAVACPLFTEWKNLLVWNKANAGLGAFYRSKHELVLVFKSGSAPHINNFGLGDKGRYRSNVLDYAGANSFGRDRAETFDAHPTVKPCALIADLIRDCSKRNGIILDPFSGSGTTILAAQRTGRQARAMEIDPLYVDLAVRRWQKATGLKACHAKTGLQFGEGQPPIISTAYAGDR